MAFPVIFKRDETRTQAQRLWGRNQESFLHLRRNTKFLAKEIHRGRITQ